MNPPFIRLLSLICRRILAVSGTVEPLIIPLVSVPRVILPLVVSNTGAQFVPVIPSVEKLLV